MYQTLRSKGIYQVRKVVLGRTPHPVEIIPDPTLLLRRQPPVNLLNKIPPCTGHHNSARCTGKTRNRPHCRRR